MTHYWMNDNYDKMKQRMGNGSLTLRVMVGNMPANNATYSTAMCCPFLHHCQILLHSYPSHSCVNASLMIMKGTEIISPLSQVGNIQV